MPFNFYQVQPDLSGPDMPDVYNSKGAGGAPGSAGLRNTSTGMPNFGGLAALFGESESKDFSPSLPAAQEYFANNPNSTALKPTPGMFNPQTNYGLDNGLPNDIGFEAWDMFDMLGQ